MNANDVTFAFVRLQLTAATLGLKKDTIKGILLPLKHLHKQKVVKFSDTGVTSPILRPVIQPGLGSFQAGDCFQRVGFQVKAVGWKTQLDYGPGSHYGRAAAPK